VPNECPQDEWKGHVCDSPLDLMYPEAQETDTLATRLLDANGDDYYGHGGSWWDVQDSRYLQRLDSADVTPPSGPDSLSVTSTGPVVSLAWPAAADESAIRYRVYRDGELLLPLASKRSRQLQGKPGSTLVVGVRAVDPSGLLGPLVSARFRVGYGVVDESGALLSDTVAPPGVRFRSARIGPSGLALRWRAVKDLAGPLRGYLVERNGKPFREVRGTTVTIARAQAAGRWSIRAIDGAGNLSPRVQRVRVG
jgi:hypothetical protein